MNYKISDFQIINYGIENTQYFRGISCWFTDFNYCAYDIGNNERDALSAAIDSIYNKHDDIIDISILKKEIKKYSKKNMSKTDMENEDLYFHVGILYNLIEVK